MKLKIRKMCVQDKKHNMSEKPPKNEGQWDECMQTLRIYGMFLK